MEDQRPKLPGDISDEVGLFDRFAGLAANLVSRAPFFAACVALVVVWVPSVVLFKDVDTWQLVINTATTIVTFLLVALLQNSQHRADLALQHKMNGIAQALADFMCAQDDDVLADDVAELEAAVGLEQRETSTDD